MIAVAMEMIKNVGRNLLQFRWLMMWIAIVLGYFRKHGMHCMAVYGLLLFVLKCIAFDPGGNDNFLAWTYAIYLRGSINLYNWQQQGQIQQVVDKWVNEGSNWWYAPFSRARLQVACFHFLPWAPGRFLLLVNASFGPHAVSVTWFSYDDFVSGFQGVAVGYKTFVHETNLLYEPIEVRMEGARHQERKKKGSS